MNQKIDPCNDFYAYSCSKWRFHNPAQLNGYINTDQFQLLAKGMERKLNNFLLTKRTENENDGENKIKNFYDSCLLAETEVEKYRLSLNKFYKEIGEFSTFKTMEQINDNNFKWWSTVANIQKYYGKSIILGQNSLQKTNENETTTIIYIAPPKDMLQNDQQQQIHKYMKTHLNIVNADAEIMAKNAVKFENKLAVLETNLKYGQQFEELLTLYNLEELVEKYKHLFDLKEYLEIVLNTQELPTQIYVYNESYFEDLHDVINTTAIEIVEDYILWLLLEEFMLDFTNNNIKMQCLNKTKKYFGNYIDHIIYKQYRSQESEDTVQELWQHIKITFKHNLENDRYYWLQNATRDEAIKKLDNMNLIINSYENENFTEILQNLTIDPNNYVTNIDNLLKHAQALRENHLISLQPVYNNLENIIKIPVALLQPRHSWDSVYPKAIQYGTLGYLIAHQMLHGFDENGRKYNANGLEQLWWDEKSIYEYESRRKCFEDQYLKYNYNGKSLMKFINSGLTIAYDAYKKWLSKQNSLETFNAESEILPRLPLNNHQLFFLSFSQLWCEEIHSVLRGTFLNGEIPSPGKFRVMSALWNSREFSWHYKCDVSSKMNPAMKCEIY